MSDWFSGVSSLFDGAKGLASTAKFAASVIGAGASIYGGIAGAKAANKNAKLIKSNAQREADIKRKQTARLAGQQRASFAAAGIQIEGSPALVIEETEQLGEEEAQNILAYGDANADAYKSQATGSLVGGILGGGSSLLGGYAQNKLYQSQLGSIG